MPIPQFLAYRHSILDSGKVAWACHRGRRELGCGITQEKLSLCKSSRSLHAWLIVHGRIREWAAVSTGDDEQSLSFSYSFPYFAFKSYFHHTKLYSICSFFWKIKYRNLNLEDHPWGSTTRQRGVTYVDLAGGVPETGEKLSLVSSSILFYPQERQLECWILQRVRNVASLSGEKGCLCDVPWE